MSGINHKIWGQNSESKTWTMNPKIFIPVILWFQDINSIDLISGFGAGQCLVQCNDEECYKRACCLMDDELQQVVSKSPKVRAFALELDSTSTYF